MLALRPNYEICDIDLPAQSAEARICSYECTNCAACADDLRKGFAQIAAATWVSA